MSQVLSDLRAGGGLITSVVGGNNITVNTVGTVATVNVSGTTQYAVQTGNAVGALNSLPLGTAGQVLTSNGAGLYPTWQDIGAVTVSYAQVYNTGAQTVNSGSNVLFDSNGLLLNVTHVAGSDTITVNDTGLYLIQYILSTQTDLQTITLLKNGVAEIPLSFVYYDNTVADGVGQGIVSLSSGDTVQLQIVTASGTPLFLENQANFVNASITLQKLNVATGTAASAALFNTDAGIATVAGATINIVGASGITTSGAGNTVTVTANPSSIFPWSVITVSQTAAVNNGYFINSVGSMNLALPAVSAVGDVIEAIVVSNGSTLNITQAAGQQIFFGNTNTTLGAGGSLQSTSIGDAIKLVCRTANTVWYVASTMGNFTVV